MLEDKSPARTSLSQLGEFGLIDHLTNQFEITQASTLKGIGDDAAVLDFADKKAVVSTDLLIEGVHFDLAYMPLKHLGYKAVVANVSDICAMNAKATQITVSVAVSNRFPLEALEELFDGITVASQEYNVDVIGGDTTSSQKGLIISITAIGEADESELVYRNGAKESNLLVVSGDIGAAYTGLQVVVLPTVSLPSPSDLRLKNIIELVDCVNGINIYDFEYIDKPGEIYRGVIAQELLDTEFREAVILEDGYYKVDYSMLGIEFKKIN